MLLLIHVYILVMFVPTLGLDLIDNIDDLTQFNAALNNQSTNINIKSIIFSFKLINFVRTNVTAKIQFLSAISTISELGYDFSITATREDKSSLALSPSRALSALPQGENITEFVYHMTSNGIITWNTPRRIPKLIMQTWKSHDISSHSKSALHSRESLLKFASDYIYVLWTDNELVDFIRMEYPQYLKFYLSLKLNVKKADIARYLCIHRFGGIYSDLDITLSRNITELVQGGLSFHDKTLFQLAESPTASSISMTLSSINFSRPVDFFTYKSIEFERDTFGLPTSFSTRQRYKKVEKHHESFAGNALFGSIKGFPLYMRVIEDAIRCTPSSCPASDNPVADVLRHTGPINLGRNLDRMLGWNSSARLSRVELILSDGPQKVIGSVIVQPHIDGFSPNNSFNVRVYSAKVIGNAGDKSTHATHGREHKWSA